MLRGLERRLTRAERCLDGLVPLTQQLTPAITISPSEAAALYAATLSDDFEQPTSEFHDESGRPVPPIATEMTAKEASEVYAMMIASPRSLARRRRQ